MMLGVTAFAATSITHHLANIYKFGAAPAGREYFDSMTFDPDSRRLYLSHGTGVLVHSRIGQWEAVGALPSNRLPLQLSKHSCGLRSRLQPGWLPTTLVPGSGKAS